jgi:hypothetical protein
MVPVLPLDGSVRHLLPDLALVLRQHHWRQHLEHHLQERSDHLQQLHPALHLKSEPLVESPHQAMIII